MPYASMALGPLPRYPSLDAPPSDNAAVPEETATPNNVETPEKDVTPEDPASPEGGDRILEYPSRHEASLHVPTNYASWLNPLDLLNNLALEKCLLL